MQLEFNEKSNPSDISDRLQLIQIIFGEISNLPPEHKDKESMNDGWAIAIQPNGVDTEFFNKKFQSLSQDPFLKEINILITQSNHDSDDRWYIIGDIPALFKAAKNEEIELPISTRYDFLIDKMEKYKDNEIHGPY